MYVVSIAVNRITRIDADQRMQTSQKKKLDFHTRGTIIIVHKVEIHGWLLSGSEELTILCCSFFTLLNK